MAYVNFQWEIVALWLLIATVFAVMAASLAWLWRDANRHGQPGWLWTLVAFLFYPIGLLVWLVARIAIRSYRIT